MDVSTLAENKKAKADYVAKYGKEPGTFFDQGYAAMQAVLNAIKVSGGTEYAGLEKAFKGSFVDTAVGKIKFDSKGDAEGVGFSVFQVKGGKFVELK
jgi:branched-chain amino acid transport system substrate-binding protein